MLILSHSKFKWRQAPRFLLSSETVCVVTNNIGQINYSKDKGIPLQAWEGSWGFRRLRLLDVLDTRHYEGGKIVTLTHRPPSPPGNSWYSFIEAESTPGHMVLSEPQKKSQAKPPGIDPETLRLAAQCLNHYATPGPK